MKEFSVIESRYLLERRSFLFEENDMCCKMDNSPFTSKQIHFPERDVHWKERRERKCMRVLCWYCGIQWTDTSNNPKFENTYYSCSNFHNYSLEQQTLTKIITINEFVSWKDMNTLLWCNNTIFRWRSKEPNCTKSCVPEGSSLEMREDFTF